MPCIGVECSGMQNASCPYRRCKTCCTKLSSEEREQIVKGAKCNPHKVRVKSSTPLTTPGALINETVPISGKFMK